MSYYLSEKGTVQGKVDKIKSETSSFKTQAVELESKTTEAKKYQTLWKKLTDNKKNTGGIKMDDVNAKLVSAAEKYNITGTNIRVTLPEVLKDGLFNRATVQVLFTTVNLTFSSVNDIKALLFVNEFIESLPGYPIITAFEIRKNKDYTTQDFIDISSGKSSGAINGKLDFFWYAYKELEKKTGETKPTPSENNPEANAPKPTL